MEPIHEDGFYTRLARLLTIMKKDTKHCAETKTLYARKSDRLNRMLSRSNRILEKGRELQKEKQLQMREEEVKRQLRENTEKLLSPLKRMVKGSIRFIIRRVRIKSDVDK